MPELKRDGQIKFHMNQTFLLPPSRKVILPGHGWNAILRARGGGAAGYVQLMIKMVMMNMHMTNFIAIN